MIIFNARMTIRVLASVTSFNYSEELFHQCNLTLRLSAGIVVIYIHNEISYSQF